MKALTLLALISLICLNTNSASANGEGILGETVDTTPNPRVPQEVQRGHHPLLAPESIAVEQSPRLMKVSWDAVEEATSYRLVIRDYVTRKVLYARSGIRASITVHPIMYGRFIFQVAAKRSGEQGPFKSVFHKVLTPQPVQSLRVLNYGSTVCADWRFKEGREQLATGIVA